MYSSRNSGSRRHGGSRGGFSQTRARSFGRRPSTRGSGEHIHESFFINKAKPRTEAVAYTPRHAFSDFTIREDLKKSIADRGYVTPTPIQDQSIPHVLLGKDFLGIADTGTGKTAAFLIPLIDKVLKDPKQSVLVVVPTRELAIQIESELRGLVGRMPVYSTTCVGGANMRKQISDLRHRQNFVIGTPGRLMDLAKNRYLPLIHFQTVVLDEADRMLDMGFITDIRAMLAEMPEKKQTLFFSATLSPEIERLIGDFLNDPVRVSVKTGNTSQNIEQDVVRITGGASKIDVLHDLLLKEEFSRVIVFGRTKHGTERLSEILVERGFKAESIHGNKNLAQRQRALARFKDGQVKILVATDVAARGIDVRDVSHVINYDLPATRDDYVHRIGRTGRADKMGKALTFIERR